MNELVNKILDIEKKANELIESQKSKLLNIQDEVENIVLEKTKQMEEKEKIRIEKIRQIEKEDEDVKIKELQEAFSKSVSELTSGIENNKEKWVLEIFDRIIS